MAGKQINKNTQFNASNFLNELPAWDGVSRLSGLTGSEVPSALQRRQARAWLASLPLSFRPVVAPRQSKPSSRRSVFARQLALRVQRLSRQGLRLGYGLVRQLFALTVHRS